MIRILASLFCLLSIATTTQASNPTLLDDQFALPEGFHIYKAAPSSLTGGSYVLCFDGEGKLLVGTGETIHRLSDTNQDGVFDDAATIVTGLGPRGPQGILVHDEHLYAVGGDGVQHYTGYPDNIVHQGRLGEPFHTGGDHAAHTLIRGHDDWIYLVTGDGGGTRDRLHITEENSPVQRERKASVFRFNLSGTQWECVSTGGRNPPNLGMNALGELFSLDSDMEWHVDVPWYRPVRLNHWLVGADLGWQGVGAYPPYYIDTIPGIVDAGRGSPTWGSFYEHQQFPVEYENAFIVCDYRWKSATKGSYNASGRLLSFKLEMESASWKSEMEILAKPNTDAIDATGQPIDFAVVDVTIAPDGSLLISDHNQGLWRLFYQEIDQHSNDSVPPLLPAPPTFKGSRAELIEQVLNLPQPQSEWTRQQTNDIKKRIGVSWRPALQQYVLNEARPLKTRLRALRLISPSYRRISGSFFVRLAKSAHPELRGQAAWLTGLQGAAYHPQVLHPLLADQSAFVRRRAAEALTRVGTQRSIPPLLEALEDPERTVRYTAMQALAHLPSADWFELAIDSDHPQRVMRALVAAKSRHDLPASETILNLVTRLITQSPQTTENQLDLLRIFGLFRETISNDLDTKNLVSNYLNQGFPAKETHLRWEQTRLLGDFQVSPSIAPLLLQLEAEQDGMTRFHVAEALSKIGDGWTDDSRFRLIKWLVGNQTGWFSDFAGKGLQFPSFWGTVLKRFHANHKTALENALTQLSPNSQLGRMVIDDFITHTGAESQLIEFYKNEEGLSGRLALLETMKRKTSPILRSFSRAQLRNQAPGSQIKDSLFGLLLAQDTELADAPLLWRHFQECDSATQLNLTAKRLTKLAHQHGSSRLRSTLQLGESIVQNRATLNHLILRLQEWPQAALAFDSGLSLVSQHQRNNSLNTPRWIWSPSSGKHIPTVYIRREFFIDSNTEALLEITGDNAFTAHLDGELIAKNDEWTRPKTRTIALSAGRHELAIQVRSDDPTAGLLCSLTWPSNDSLRIQRLISNVAWETTHRRPNDWPRTSDPNVEWRAAIDLGAHGVSPWGSVFDSSASAAIESQIIAGYWEKWYQDKFGEQIKANGRDLSQGTLSIDTVRTLLTDASLTRGNIENGQTVYLKSQCQSCHQGVQDVPGRIFGPDLSGVTRRLTREQLADAILSPSKEVSDRFRATEIETTSGSSYSGFVTEQSADQIVIATQTNILTVPRTELESIQPLKTSLMPEGLLGDSTQQDIIDLLSFLNSL